MGRILKEISQKGQVICITHLAPVAAAGNKHYLVEKEVSNGRTLTKVFPLTENDRINELARMLGGGSDAVRRHAKELLK